MHKGYYFLIVIILVLTMLILTSCGVRATRIDKEFAYLKANEYLEEGNISAALFYYAVANDYKDARTKYAELYGHLNSAVLTFDYLLALNPEEKLIGYTWEWKRDYMELLLTGKTI